MVNFHLLSILIEFTSIAGHVVRMCDQMLLIAFMDRKFCFITATSDSYREPKEAINSGNLEKQVENKVLFKSIMTKMIYLL
jgi:hypothetical protein